MADIIQSAAEAEAPLPELDGPPEPYRYAIDDDEWFKRYADVVAGAESTYRPAVVNGSGFVGLYQMGTMALKDAGYIKMSAPNSNKSLKDPKNWIGTNGIKNIEDFKKSPDAQTKALRKYARGYEKTLKKNKKINADMTIEERLGHVGGSHLIGAQGYSDNPLKVDGNGKTGKWRADHVRDQLEKYTIRSNQWSRMHGEKFEGGPEREEELPPLDLETAEDWQNQEQEPQYHQFESEQHVVSSGDTLGTIASKYLGDSKRWQELQTFNGITDPNKISKGQVIKIPAPADAKREQEQQFVPETPWQPVVSKAELSKYDVHGDFPKQQRAIANLMGDDPTNYPDMPEVGQAAEAEEQLDKDIYDIKRDVQFRQEHRELDEQTFEESMEGATASTTPAALPDDVNSQLDAIDNMTEDSPVQDVDSQLAIINNMTEDTGGVDSQLDAINNMTEDEPEEQTPDYSIAETVALHSAQGTTFGTSETITGGAYAIEQMMTGENAHRSFGEAFEVGREAAKEMNRESAKQNPVTAVTTDIGSGIATSILLPGSGLLKAKGAVATAKAVGAGAAEGAVAGLGYSQDGEELFGAGLGGAFGAGGTLVMKGAGKGWRWYKGEELTKELAEQAYETGSAQLAKRVDEKMYGSNSTDTIHYGALGEDMDIESLLLTDNPRVFRAELERIEIPDVDSSYDLLSRNVRYDSKKYGLDYNKQLKEMQQIADDKAYQDLGETGVGDAVDLSGAEPHIVYTPQDITAINTMAVFRAESVSFMRYVTNADARASAKNFVGKGYVPPTSSSADQIGELVGEFRKAQKAGLADESAYRAFRLHKYTLESARDIKSEWISKKSRELMESDGYRRKDAIQSARMEFKETLGKDISERERKFLENNFMFREIDRTTKGMDTEMLQNQAYRHGLMKDFFETKVLVEVRKATKAIRKSKYSESDIHLMMTRAELGELKIPNDAQHVVAAVTKATKFVREASESLGLKIGDKGDFYVPKRRLQGAEYVHALTEFYNSKVQGAKGTLGDLIRSTVDKTDQEVEQMIKLVSRDKAEMIGFVQEMRRVVDGDLNVASIDSIFRSGSLQSGTLKKVVKELDANALHTRNDILPEFIIDRNLGRSLLKNVTEAGDLIFMEPVGRLLDGRAQILRGLGKDNASEAVMNFRRDITGQARKSKLSSTYDWVDKMKMKYGSKPVSAALDFYEMSVSAIYPNLVGGNPASVVRNLTQVITKTIPEMGMWSPRKIASAYGSALDQLKTAEGREALKRAGIISSDRSGLISEIGSTSVLTDSALANFQRSWNNFSMMAFNASDDLNRVVTAELALDISTAIVKKDPKALKYIDKLPPAIKSKALRIFRSDGYEIIDKRGFEIAVRDHFEVQTQIAYGKIGNSEFVRDNGRLFSMMTKWPIQVGSDIYSMTKQRKFISRFTQKYFGPLVLANMAAHQVKDAVGDDEELDAKTKFFLGNQYGGNFTGLSALSGPSALSPALTGMFAGVQGGGDMIEGLLYDDERVMRKGVKGVTGGVMQYVPVVGGGFKMYDRVQRGFYGDSPRLDNLLLSDEYDYDY